MSYFLSRYRKVPKFLEAKKLCCNLPKIQTKRPNLSVFCQNDANGTANSEDPDQTAPVGSCRVCTVCPDPYLSVRKFRIIKVTTIMLISLHEYAAYNYLPLLL